MDSATEYFEIGQWVFFALSTAVAFLLGKLLSTGRKAAEAIECAAKIPELLEGLRVAMRVQQRMIVYQKYILRLLVLSILRPADVDEKLHKIQADLADDMEDLGK